MTRRRAAIGIVIVTLATLALPLLLPASSGPGVGGLAAARASSPVSTLLSLVNDTRSQHGLGALAWSDELAAVAQERAQIMAAAQTLSHTPDLGARICCEVWFGENSGYGASPAQLHAAFMGSAPHAANILQADADDVGIGVASAGGWLWVTEVFRARDGAAAASSGGSGRTATGQGRDVQAAAASRSGGRTAPPVTVDPAALLQARMHTLRLRVADHADPLRRALSYPGTLAAVARLTR